MEKSKIIEIIKFLKKELTEIGYLQFDAEKNYNLSIKLIAENEYQKINVHYYFYYTDWKNQNNNFDGKIEMEELN